MQWYYSKNGVQLGPVGVAELRAKLATGEVAPSELVWRDGMSDWVPASLVPELMGQAPPAPVIAGGSSSPYAPPVQMTTAVGTLGDAHGPRIPNYLWQSIVVTVLCCLPFGIPAIVYAAKVDSLRASGDIPGAMQASANAKMWAWVSFGCGLAVYGLWFLAFFGSMGGL
jgi:hypothetical protein